MVASVEVLELVGDGVGDGVTPEFVVVGVGVGVGDGVDVAVVLTAVGVAVGAVVVPPATGLAETTTPDGAVVGLSGLLPVTLPPPEEQEAAATTAAPANTASINCLYIEHSKTMRRSKSRHRQ